MMKKILIALFILLSGLMVVFLVAFNGDPDESNVVRVWFSQYTEENEALSEIGDRFTSETGITVEVVSRINVFNAATDLVNNAELDDRPDLVFMQAPDIGGLIASGYLLPLDDFLTEEIRSRYADVAFDAFSYQGETYGIGYSIDTYGLLYNKDLISETELPSTWEEYFAIGEDLTLFAGDEVVQWGILMNSRDIWFNYPILKEYGGYYYGIDEQGEYDPQDVGFDDPGMLQYVAKVADLKTKGMVLNNKIQGESEIVYRFSNGKVAMMIYGLWYAATFKEKGLNYGIASLPDQTDGTTSKALTTVQGFVVNGFSENSDETLAFLSYLLRDENQQLLIEAGNGNDEKLGTRNPANLSVMASDYIQSDEILSSLSALNDECEPFPNIPEGTIWYNYTTTVFQSIFFGSSSGDPVDPATKLAELCSAIASDVEAMNMHPNRIDVPSWFWFVLIVIAIGAVAIYIIVCRNKCRQEKIQMKKRISWKETILAWGLMIPLLGLLGLFYVYPIFHNFYLSFTDYSGTTLRDFGIVGVANYKAIFTEALQGLASMTIWTVVFAVSVVVISFIFGTLLAAFLNKVRIQIAKFYRIIFILPWVIPTVITLLMWQGLLETDNGLINQMLNLIGIRDVPWLSDPLMAKISTIFVMVWFSFPYYMVIATGHLKAIPKDYYEAAKIDGANGFYIFWKITLPLIFRALIPTLIMSFIMQFNQFGVYILTQGGPASDTIGAPGATDLLITYVFNTAFNTNSYALAAAYSVIIFVFVALFSVAAMRVGRKLSED